MKKSTSLISPVHIQLSGRTKKLLLLIGLTAFTHQIILASGQTATNTNVTQQNTVVIKGKVFDEKGQPAIGANVIVKGTTNGAITDIDGNYSLKVPSKATLIVSYIGYQPQQIILNGKSVVNINLVVDSKSLDEVVVVGYGQVKRANLVGSVSSLSSEKIKDIPSSNLTALLEGQMGGVSVGQASGNPTATATLSIRNYGYNPVYVIDDVLYDDGGEAFNLLDPTEIESFSILKDGSAAVYGVRAAGGAVVVKTKRGKEGKAKINYSGSYGISDATRITKTMSAYEHATFLNDGLIGSLGSKEEAMLNSAYYTDDELEAFKSLNYNWLDEAWKSSMMNRQTVNISGGSSKVKYFGSGTYYYETGNFDRLYAKKQTLRLGLDAEITKDLTASFTLSTDSKTESRPYNSSDTEPDPLRGTFSTLLQTPKWIPAYITDPNGETYPVGQNILANHPIEVENSGSYHRTKNQNIKIEASATYKIPYVQGLSASFNFARINSNGFSTQYRKPYNIYNFVTTGEHGHIIGNTLDPLTPFKTITNSDRFMQDASDGWSNQMNTSLNYSRKFGKHDVKALAIYEQAEAYSEGVRAYRDGMIIDNYEAQEGFDPARSTTATTRSNSARKAYIGRLNYTYGDRYMLEAAGRIDGSTKFAPGYRYGFFYSLSGGWRVSEEKFFKDNVDFIDNLKLRGSIGLLGRDSNLKDFQYQYIYNVESGNGALFGTTQTTALVAQNSGLIAINSTWEKSRITNYGVDLKFKNNISLTFDGFYNHRYDMLQANLSSLPYTAGIDKAPSVNTGEEESFGYDIELGYNGKFNKDWGYNVSANLSWSLSRTLVVDQSPGVIGTWKDEIGKRNNLEVGYFAKDIIRTQAQLDAILAKNPNYTIFGQKPTLGMLDYVDVGGANYSNTPDGIIDENDQRNIGMSNPYGFGFNLGVNWKSLSISTTISGAFGGDVFYDKSAFTLPTATANGPSFWTDHWTPENPNAAYPRAWSNAATQRSTFWMRDGLTMDLKTLNISYSVPARTFQKLGISGVRAYFTGRNLVNIINPLPYKDPNIALYNGYPLMRSFNFGLNFSL